ncbi:hypothetical protein SAMN05421594_2813 [Chryseobacterium oleae]|uniref:Uncharacterized protein n=1 Tax=Chryseobacterium oleae TaxID=491207 RepID=A0A1I4Z0L5_CHROL|nr:hypothetical protein [Chryseobacterium oleae]SFN43727.1 hypothetical protein SAMN05421594_2813 [Chryseobacterium oleae]
MKENIRKIKIVIILLLIFNFNYLEAQTKTQNSLYHYFDKWIEDKKTFKFIQINLMVDCKNKLLFTVSKKDLLFCDEKKSRIYKTYFYKGVLIIYELDDNMINNKNINFFDRYLQSTDYDIKMLPKGNQSLINGYVLYFKNNKLVTNEEQINYFMENNCKSSE